LTDSGEGPFQLTDSGEGPFQLTDSGESPFQLTDSGLGPFQLTDSAEDPFKLTGLMSGAAGSANAVVAKASMAMTRMERSIKNFIFRIIIH